MLPATSTTWRSEVSRCCPQCSASVPVGTRERQTRHPCRTTPAAQLLSWPLVAALLGLCLTTACAPPAETDIRPFSGERSEGAIPPELLAAVTETPSSANREAGPLPTAPQPPEPSDSGQRLPEEIVGTWRSSEGSVATVYRFTEEGGYGRASVLWQERRSGLFTYEVSSRGHVTMTGSVLDFEPVEGRQRRTDPRDPGGDFDQTSRIEPFQLTWAIEEGPVLLLTDSTDTDELRPARER